MVFPTMRTSVNLMERGVERSPVGLARDIWKTGEVNPAAVRKAALGTGVAAGAHSQRRKINQLPAYQRALLYSATGPYALLAAAGAEGGGGVAKQLPGPLSGYSVVPRSVKEAKAMGKTRLVPGFMRKLPR